MVSQNKLNDLEAITKAQWLLDTKTPDLRKVNASLLGRIRTRT